MASGVTVIVPGVVVMVTLGVKVLVRVWVALNIITVQSVDRSDLKTSIRTRCRRRRKIVRLDNGVGRCQRARDEAQTKRGRCCVGYSGVLVDLSSRNELGYGCIRRNVSVGDRVAVCRHCAACEVRNRYIALHCWHSGMNTISTLVNQTAQKAEVMVAVIVIEFERQADVRSGVVVNVADSAGGWRNRETEWDGRTCGGKDAAWAGKGHRKAKRGEKMRKTLLTIQDICLGEVGQSEYGLKRDVTRERGLRYIDLGDHTRMLCAYLITDAIHMVQLGEPPAHLSLVNCSKCNSTPSPPLRSSRGKDPVLSRELVLVSSLPQGVETVSARVRGTI